MAVRSNLKPLAMRAARVALRRQFSSVRELASFDVVVVGGGIVGAWAAVRAAVKGASVALVEQFARGHTRGSSHGDGRIWRMAYEEDLYVDMMEQSLSLWSNLEANTGATVMQQTGMLCFEDAATSGTMSLNALMSLFEKRGVAHERLDGSAVREKFPKQFGGVPDDADAVYLDAAGALFATKAVEATWQLAEALGVQTFEGRQLQRLDAGHALCSDGLALEARQAIILAPGAWLTAAARDMCGIDIPTRITAECVSYHMPKSEDYSLEAGMPVFTMRVDNGLGPHGYYGIPKIDVPGVKVSAHHCGPVVQGSPPAIGAAEFPVRDDPVVDSNTRLVSRFWPDDRLDPQPFETQRCFYTSTPDGDYILGPVPGKSQFILAGGGSGHAFKMGPAIGDAVACLALRLPLPFDITQFALDRPAVAQARGVNPVPTAAKCK